MKLDRAQVASLVASYRRGAVSLDDLRKFCGEGSAYAAAALAEVAATAEGVLRAARYVGAVPTAAAVKRLAEAVEAYDEAVDGVTSVKKDFIVAELATAFGVPPGHAYNFVHTLVFVGAIEEVGRRLAKGARGPTAYRVKPGVDVGALVNELLGRLP